MLVSSRSRRQTSARTALVKFLGGFFLAGIPDPRILPFQPWFNEEGAEGEKGSYKNDSASGVTPSRGLPNEPKKKAEENEKDSMNHSGEVDGFLMSLNPLHHNRAIEKHEVGKSLKQADCPQSADRSFQHPQHLVCGCLFDDGQPRLFPSKKTTVEMVYFSEAQGLPECKRVRASSAALTVNQIGCVSI